MSPAATPRLPATFNRLAWSNLAAQSAEQIALAAAPIVAVLLLGVGEGQTGLLQTALTLPFILFAIPAGLLADRISRRWLMAGSEALRAAALAANPAADLAWADDPAAAFAARLRRGLRHGRLQRRRARAGALAGDAATIAGGECADRTGAHRCLRQRPGARRRAGRMGRRRARVRICRRALGDRGRAAVGHLRAGARARAAAPSAAGHQGRRCVRAASSAAAAGVHHPVHLQHGVVPAARRVRALRRAPSRPVRHRRRHDARDVWRRHGGRRARGDARDAAARLRHRDRARARSPASSPRP